MISTSAKCIGRWPAILKSYGLSDRNLSGKHGPCPLCDGKDRFRFADQDGRGNFYCSGCGHGDAFELLTQFTGKAFKELAMEIDQIVDTFKPGKIQVTDYDRNNERLATISRGLIQPGKEVRSYLQGRGLSPSKNVRQHNKLPYWQDGKVAGNYPAMVTRISTHDGNLATYHITYLDDGKKADVEHVKKLMPPCAATRGGAIRLTDIYPEIGLAEGVETALAVMKRFKMPCWATGTAGLMESFIPPDGVESVVIYADRDKSFTGEKAAYNLAHSLAIKGFKVRVEVPEITGDFADVLAAVDKVKR